MDFGWSSVRNGILPPPPRSVGGSRAFENVGQRLLALVRSLDKADESTTQEIVEDISEVLRNIIAFYSRRGLLQGDLDAAEKVLANNAVLSSTNSASAGRREKRSRKSGRRGDSKEIDFITQDSTFNNGESTPNNGVQDESLVVSAIVRILDQHGEEKEEESTSTVHRFHLVGLAAQLISSITEPIKSSPSNSSCAEAENEILGANSRALLTGLSKSIDTILKYMARDSLEIKGNSGVVLCDGRSKTVSTEEPRHAGPANYALPCCLQAAAFLLALFGTSLSRSSALLSSLNRAGWTALTIPNDEIQWCAARLLGSIPLAGGVSKSTPAEAWNASVVESAAVIFTLLGNIAISKGKSKEPTNEEYLSKDLQVLLPTWLDHIRASLKPEQRGKAFYCLLSGWVKYLVSLLRRDGYGSRSHSVLITTHLPVTYLLDLTEAMVSFTTASESFYYATKKRLRQETIAGGLVSAQTVAFDIASFVKSLGHDVFDALLAAMSGTALLPHARRVARISYVSLFTSCSGPLRRVLDPTSSTQLDGNRRRWLHSSILLRVRAVETFKAVVSACGSNVVVASSPHQGEDKTRANVCCQGISVVAGCLLEQVMWHTASEEIADDDWGAFDERRELVVAAAETLAACVVVCRGFMPIPTRQLLDSVVSTCLSMLCDRHTNHLSSLSDVRSSLLILGTKCIYASTADGALSSFTDTLRQAAQMYTQDSNPTVTTAAYSALCVCDTVAMPRVPPLSFTVRSELASERNSQPHEETASSLTEQLLEFHQKQSMKIKTDLKEPPAREELDAETPATQEKRKRRKTEPRGSESSSTTHPEMIAMTANATSTPLMDDSRTVDRNPEHTEHSKAADHADDADDTRICEDSMALLSGTDGTLNSVVKEASGEAESSKDSREVLLKTDSEATGMTKEVAEEKADGDSDDESDVPDIFDGGPDEDDV